MRTPPPLPRPARPSPPRRSSARAAHTHVMRPAVAVHSHVVCVCCTMLRLHTVRVAWCSVASAMPVLLAQLTAISTFYACMSVHVRTHARVARHFSSQKTFASTSLPCTSGSGRTVATHARLASGSASISRRTCDVCMNVASRFDVHCAMSDSLASTIYRHIDALLLIDVQRQRDMASRRLRYASVTER